MVLDWESANGQVGALTLYGAYKSIQVRSKTLDTLLFVTGR